MNRRGIGMGLRRSGGFTLIEALVFISLWLLVVGFAFTLFYRTWTTTKRFGRSTDDLVRALAAGERWREEIRGAVGAPRLAAESGFAGEALHIPTAAGDVVYAFTGSNVVRRVESGSVWVEWVTWVKGSEMIREDRRGVPCWRWELELRARGEEVTVPPLFSFEAVSEAEVAR
jgi:hypothetical protein